jgi:hypothetical protein
LLAAAELRPMHEETFAELCRVQQVLYGDDGDDLQPSAFAVPRVGDDDDDEDEEEDDEGNVELEMTDDEEQEEEEEEDDDELFDRCLLLVHPPSWFVDISCA